MRVGIGYDAHRLAENRKLIIGGVCIPFDRGLLGHSDADVLVHAIIDALLGAAGKGDIGMLFPDNDMKFKDISSIELLKTVGELYQKEQLNIVNIDSVIIAEIPKMSRHFDEMKKNICEALNITPDRLNIKAKTEEGMGFTGTGQGIAAKAVCLAGFIA